VDDTVVDLTDLRARGVLGDPTTPFPT
jgi:hypothetical protein